MLLAHVCCCAHPSPQREDQGRSPARVNARLPRGLRLPPPQKISLRGKGILIELFSVGFAQGQAVYLELSRHPAAHKGEFSVRAVSFNMVPVPVTKKEWGYRGIFGIDPESRPAVKKLQVVYTVDGMNPTERFDVTVGKSVFQYYPIPLDLGKYSDVEYRLTKSEVDFINRCSARKHTVFNRNSPDRLGDGLAHPRDQHMVTSPFWSRRVIMRYKIRHGKKIRQKDMPNVHKGIDLRGKTGDPVYCMADGRVVLAEPMYYEGNFIVVDHGNRFFTYYMHLSGFTVKEGDAVRAGDRIGRVGSTGLSTASHLHVSARVRDVEVDPLSILVLPLRK